TFQISDGRFQVDFREQRRSDVRLPDFRLQASLQTSDFRLQTSDFRLQTSDFRLQTWRRPLHRRRVLLTVLHGNQLGQDADRYLLWRDGADVEANRGVDAFEQLRRHTVGGERVVDSRDFCAAAKQAEIAQLSRREDAQRLEIVGVAASDDHGVGVGREVRVVDPRRDVLDDDLDGAREPLRVRELLAVVDDMNAESDIAGQTGKVEADVAGANHVELRRRLDRLDVDVHLSTADETGFLREVVGELVVDHFRPARLDRFARLPEGVVLVAAAADRADLAAVTKHQHLRADPLRRRPGRGDDRHQRRQLAAFEGIDNGGEDLLVHLSGLYAGVTDAGRTPSSARCRGRRLR